MPKKPKVLIICGLVVVLAIVLLIIYLARGGSTSITRAKPGNNNNQEVGIPDLTLSAYPETETEGNVEISILATVKDGSEIMSLTTPDGKTVGYSSNKTYKVDTNGEYTFTVTASNGKSATRTINIQNITKISADNPYIPDGFEHIDGTDVDTGFTIEDESGNQYVWIPVESGIPTRTIISTNYKEDDYTVSSLTNSIAKYYGFYIASYEASKDTVNGKSVAKSVPGVIPWSNVDYTTAYNASKNTASAYNYTGVKTALINSYAWDTTMEWLNKSVVNYSSSRNYGNYSNQIAETGNTESDVINGIADMAGNLREWTTEIYEEPVLTDPEDEDNENNNSSEENTVGDDAENNGNAENRVIRGGSATMDKVANSRIGQRIDLQDNYWGFRIVLYKE